MATLLVAMTGCQKEPQTQPEKNNGLNAEGVGYVSLKISLPSSTATKAEAFDDGKAYEYKVNTVNVIFYDESGNYQYDTQVSPEPWDNNNGSDITVSGKTEAIKVNKAVKQALVLVNAPADVLAKKESSYSTLNAALAATTESLIGSDMDNFFMSNAPYYDANGKFTTLVPVNVKPSESQALAAAENIQVERATAKVTVIYAEEFTYNNDRCVIEGWNLDVTNNYFFPVREGFDSDGANEWFSAANTPYNPGILGSSGRIYMAKDPNYAAGWLLEDGKTIENSFTGVTEGDFSEDNIAVSREDRYCLENTFNPECMNENQTTTVMLKANYIPEGIEEGETWFMVGSGKTIMSAEELADYFFEKASDASNHVTKEEAIAAANLLPAGDATESTFIDLSCGSYFGNVTCYKDGVCYYPIKIRHFTAEELGYNTEEEFKTSFENSGYVLSDIGRYGVLRNTWYNITINSIKNPGSPIIPKPTDTPDDKFEQFVACTIDILAWSVRNHGVDL